MKIIGCDFHPGYQQIAMVDTETGEFTERRLSHGNDGEEVRKFYAGLSGSVRVGLEASGQSQWFERLLAELGHELWIGDAGKIRGCADRKQKTDRRDAELLLQLLMEGRFPRIWVPTPAERDVRQLLLHRAKLVRVRTQVKK
jgi:transposase